MPVAEEVFIEDMSSELNCKGRIVISLLEKGVLGDGDQIIKMYSKWSFLDPLEFGGQVKLEGIQGKLPKMKLELPLEKHVPP